MYARLRPEWSIEESSYGSVRVYSQGDVFVKPAGYSHTNRFGESGADALHIDVERSAELGLNDLHALLRFEGLISDQHVFGLGVTFANDLACFEQHGIGNLVTRARQLVCGVNAWAKERYLKGIRWLEQLRLLLHDSFQQPLSLSELASEFRRHPVHVAKSFRAEFGCTIGDYVRRLKLSYAACLLTATDLSISSIASDSGFADQSHLTRLFKRTVGITPATYRRKQPSASLAEC